MGLDGKLNLNKGSDSLAKQICYHTMFGTYKEDLGISAQITNIQNWYTREEMGEVFKQARRGATQPRRQEAPFAAKGLTQMAQNAT